ncbi:MAG: ATP synthase F1 subunit delta [Phycisphaerales bacterium]|nr:ATP synthase F1 subunit delta [Phycisphaerales bacterium]
MPLYDAPPEALDKVYAQSLFELAEAQGGRARLETISGEIDEILELIRGHAEFSEFLASRLIGAAEREQSLARILGGRVDTLLFNFVNILNRKDRLPRLLPVFGAFQQMVQDAFGKVEVDVYTRFPLDPDQLAGLASRLRDVLKREPVMHAYIDETMIGGVKMQVADKLIDASMATQLRKMREMLLQDGMTTLRSGAGRMVEG